MMNTVRLLLSSIIFWSVISTSAISQDLSSSNDPKKHWNEDFILRPKLSLWIPMGDLNKTYNASPNIYVGFGHPIYKEKLYGEIYGEFVIPINSNDFSLNYKDTSYIANTNMLVSFGARFSWRVLIKNNFFLMPSFAPSLLVLDSDLQHPTEKDNQGNPINFSVKTFNAAMGFAVGKILNDKELGLEFVYNQSNLPNTKELNSNFGNASLTMGIFYRF